MPQKIAVIVNEFTGHVLAAVSRADTGIAATVDSIVGQGLLVRVSDNTNPMVEKPSWTLFTVPADYKGTLPDDAKGKVTLGVIEFERSTSTDDALRNPQKYRISTTGDGKLELKPQLGKAPTAKIESGKCTVELTTPPNQLAGTKVHMWAQVRKANGEKPTETARTEVTVLTIPPPGAQVPSMEFAFDPPLTKGEKYTAFVLAENYAVLTETQAIP